MSTTKRPEPWQESFTKKKTEEKGDPTFSATLNYVAENGEISDSSLGGSVHEKLRGQLPDSTGLWR